MKKRYKKPVSYKMITYICKNVLCKRYNIELKLMHVGELSTITVRCHLCKRPMFNKDKIK